MKRAVFLLYSAPSLHPPFLRNESLGLLDSHRLGVNPSHPQRIWPGSGLWRQTECGRIGRGQTQGPADRRRGCLGLGWWVLLRCLSWEAKLWLSELGGQGLHNLQA